MRVLGFGQKRFDFFLEKGLACRDPVRVLCVLKAPQG